MMNKLDYL